MFILNENNIPTDLNLIPDQCDMNFWVFDNSTGAKDYFCIPLIMIESFYSPTVKLRLTVDNSKYHPTEYFINVPIDYQILIGEPICSNLEINPISNLSGRHFKAFSINPTSSFRPDFIHIEVEEILPTIKWFFPKTSIGQLTAIPLTNKLCSPCIFIAREIPKSLEIINLCDVS